MDISLKVNDVFLDLPPDISVTLNLKSTLFDFTIIQGSLSFPFSIPATDKNKKVFGFYNRIDRSTTANFFQADLHLKGQFYRSGQLKITYSGDVFTATFIVGVGEFGKSFTDTNLSDIDMGIIEFAADYNFQTSIPNGSNPRGFNLVLGNTYYIKIYTDPNGGNGFNDADITVTKVYDTTIEDVWDYFVAQIAQLTRNASTFFYNDINYTRRVVLYEQQQDGPPPTIIGIVFQNRTRLIYLNASINATFEDGICFPQIQTTESVNVNIRDPNQGIITAPVLLNEYDSGSALTYEDENISPCLFIKYIINRVALHFNILIQGDFMDDAGTDDLIVISNIIIPITEISINLSEYVPNLTVGKLFVQLAQTFGLYYDYDALSETLIINYRKDLITSSDFIDLTAKALDNNRYIAKEQDNIQGFRFGYSDEVVSDYLVGDGSTEFITDASMLELDSSGLPIITEPRAEIKNNRNSYKQLTFLFWLRVVNNAPTADPENTVYSLRWTDDPKGLFLSFWEAYIDLIFDTDTNISNAQITYLVNLNAFDLFTIDEFKKFITEKGEFVPIQIQIKVQNRISAEISAYRTINV